MLITKILLTITVVNSTISFFIIPGLHDLHFLGAMEADIVFIY